MDKLSDTILHEQIAKTQNNSPHGIFSCRKLYALLTELAEYRRADEKAQKLEEEK